MESDIIASQDKIYYYFDIQIRLLIYLTFLNFV